MENIVNLAKRHNFSNSAEYHQNPPTDGGSSSRYTFLFNNGESLILFIEDSKKPPKNIQDFAYSMNTYVKQLEENYLEAKL